MTSQLEQRAINVIRGLAMDAVERANSGHPGTPMALAPLAHVLFTRIMKYDASEPDWPDRDRFVLSAGHASMLLYSMLYLCGFGLELDDLREFRQFGSRTPGHPERNHTPGVEVTTGPLGQGFANAVGIALAEKHLRERFGIDVIDHHVFGICSDGDLMEGISHEAASFAGHFKLNRLVFVYDDNHITIDGRTELTLTDDAVKRFEGYNWNVVRCGEIANDVDALEAALRDAMTVDDRPTLLVLRSHIGWPAPNLTDSEKAHGNALGAKEIAAVKDILEMPQEEFWVPDDVLEFYRAAGTRSGGARQEWLHRRETLGVHEAQKAEEFDACLQGRGLAGWQDKLPVWSAGSDASATRVASQEVLSSIFDLVPGLVGGGADLTGNTGTKVKGARTIDDADASGRIVPFGVREHAMGGIANGLAMSGTLPFVGTFFVFSDYMRGAVRLAALSRTKVAFVWSHDSVGLGEDGPTHQPIEQIAAMRAMPQMRVLRPADPNEVAATWRVHIEGDGPSAILLTRQNVPVLAGTAERAPQGVPRGAYVLADEANDVLDLVLIGTGSEVSICVGARDILAAEGLGVRVVSMPCWDLFEAQDAAYRAEVLPAGVATFAVEAAASFGWDRYADDSLSIDHFGASAPGKVVLEKFGYTPENVAQRARELYARRRDQEASS
ncbi:MAG: transketolase [Actinomycetia bacterium]|nr:transketolase [Actinomycetes bacterium]